MDLVGARRLAAVWAIPAVTLFVIVAPPLVLIGRLPDPLAVHWGPGGGPNGSMGFWVSLAFLGGLWVVAWLGLLVAGRRVPSSPVLAVVYFLGGILAAVQIAIVDRNLNAPDWRSAGELEWWGAALLVAAGLAAGAGGWMLGTGTVVLDSAAAPGAVPSAGLGDDEEPEWSGSAVVRWPAAVAVVVLGLVPFLPAGWRWVPVVGAAVVGSFTAVTVTVGREEVAVGIGWFGWPRRRVRLSDIERVEVVDVDPVAYGGWGYRFRPGSTAVIVRSGPGIRVVRKGRRDLVVTVDDPAGGAGVVNDVLRREGRLVEH